MKKTIFFILVLLIPLFGYCEQISVKADHLEPTVYYDIVSNKGDIVGLSVRYDDATPSAGVNDLHFYPYERKPDGKYEYLCSAIEGWNIIFRFEVEKSRLRMAQVDTNYRPTNNDEEQKVFSLRSKGGFDILITLSFKNRQITNVNIKPKINPFP